MTDWVLPALSASAATETAAALEIRLFGPMEVRIGPWPLPRLRTRKGLWLLVLLALRAGRPVERDWLAGTLWPEDADAHARRSLRQSLCDLRLALGSEAWRLTGAGPRTLRLEVSGAFVDVLAFDAALARGDLEALETAISLYRGALLEGCVEAWCLEERRRREEAYVAALERLAAAATTRRDPAGAARYLRLAVGVDPYREDLQRALMEALAGSGSPAAALLVYREYGTLLAREMAAEPAAETTTLFRRLREETRARARPLARAPSVAASTWRPDPGARGNLPEPLSAFVGREKELREIGGCLASARLVRCCDRAMARPVPRRMNSRLQRREVALRRLGPAQSAGYPRSGCGFRALLAVNSFAGGKVARHLIRTLRIGDSFPQPVRERDPRRGFAPVRQPLQRQLQNVDHQPSRRQDLQRLLLRQRDGQYRCLCHGRLPQAALQSRGAGR